MRASLRAESLKLSRLWLPAIAAGAGLVFAALIWLSLRGAAERIAHEARLEAPWQNGVIGDATVTAVLVLPTAVILLIALALFVEHRGDMAKQLRVMPRRQIEIHAAKFAILQLLVALMLVVAALGCAAGWLLLPHDFRASLSPGGFPTETIASLTLRLFVALLPIGAIQFVLSARWPNILYSVGAGLVLTFASLMLMGSIDHRWLPYAYPGSAIMARFATRSADGDVQRPDTSYRPPAGALAGGRAGAAILVDGGHANRHGIGTAAAAGTLGWLAHAAGDAKIEVAEIRVPITRDLLSRGRLLVLAGASTPLAPSEVEAIARWVESGGSVLLLADHPPFAAPLQPLARRLGAGISDEMIAGAPDAPGGNVRLLFTRAAGTVAAHPITDGADRIRTYGGQAVWSKRGGTPLLVLRPPLRTIEGGVLELPAPAGQLIAFASGKGRVVLSGETGLFTAQRAGDEPIGLGAPDSGNPHLVINTLRWLLRLPPKRA